jgi:hypothetical protein
MNRRDKKRKEILDGSERERACGCIHVKKGIYSAVLVFLSLLRADREI